MSIGIVLCITPQILKRIYQKINQTGNASPRKLYFILILCGIQLLTSICCYGHFNSSQNLPSILPRELGVQKICKMFIIISFNCFCLNIYQHKIITPLLIIILYFYIDLRITLSEKEIQNLVDLCRLFGATCFAILCNVLISITSEEIARRDIILQQKKDQISDEWKSILSDLPQTLVIFSMNNQILYHNSNFFQVVEHSSEVNSAQEIDFDLLINKFSKLSYIANRKQTMPNNLNKVCSLEKILKLYQQQIENYRLNSEAKQKLSSSVKAQVYHYVEDIDDSNKYYFELKLKFINYDQQDCILLLIDNITARIQFNTQKDISQYKNRLLSSFSHEIRTPLNGAMSPLILCMNDNSMPEILKKKYLEMILFSLRRLEYQLHDINDFSSLMQNNFGLTLSQVNMRLLFKEIKDFITPQMQYKDDLSLQIEIDKHIPVFFQTDERRTKQVIINILSNAVKFSKQGNIMVKLSVLERNNKRRQRSLQVNVIDEGIGMNNVQLQQLDALLKNPLSAQIEMNSTGSSLGLAIAQSIAIELNPVEKKGLQVDSVEGAGTYFTWIIDEQLAIKEKTIQGGGIDMSFVNLFSPRTSLICQGKDKLNTPDSNNNLFFSSDIVDKSNATKKQTELQIVQSEELTQNSNELSFNLEEQEVNACILNHTKQNTVYASQNNNHLNQENLCDCKQVMAVDDDGFNLKVLEMNLAKLNIKCELATNGKDAIKILQEKYSRNKKCENPNCKGMVMIFMDYQMPELDGVQTTKLICEMIQNGVLYPINIVACTAFGSNDDIESCRAAGMCDFAIKPIYFKTVYNLVKKWGVLNE